MSKMALPVGLKLHDGQSCPYAPRTLGPGLEGRHSLATQVALSNWSQVLRVLEESWVLGKGEVPRPGPSIVGDKAPPKMAWQLYYFLANSPLGFRGIKHFLKPIRLFSK